MQDGEASLVRLDDHDHGAVHGLCAMQLACKRAGCDGTDPTDQINRVSGWLRPIRPMRRTIEWGWFGLQIRTPKDAPKPIVTITSPSGSKPLPAIHDHGDGTYRVDFTPPETGAYEVLTASVRFSSRWSQVGAMRPRGKRTNGGGGMAVGR